MLFPGGTGGGVHPAGELQVSLLVVLEVGFTSGWVMEASLRGLLRQVGGLLRSPSGVSLCLCLSPPPPPILSSYPPE